jgi:hypothetical protein
MLAIVTAERRKLNYRDFIRRRAAEVDCSRTIEEPCAVYDQAGNLLVIYDVLEADTTPLVEALKRVKFTESTRTGGLTTTSRIFGSQPRLERRQRAFCNRASMATEHPRENAALCGVAKAISDRYQLNTPETHKRHAAIVGEKVEQEWVIPGTVFTSGIVNKNNPLAYHLDAGNFEDVFSCMLVLRKNLQGGYLCFPEIDTKFLFKNNALAMFDGQRIVHGVTPMHPAGPDSYRYSIVYYSLKGMWRCLSLDEELANARAREFDKILAKKP